MSFPPLALFSSCFDAVSGEKAAPLPPNAPPCPASRGTVGRGAALAPRSSRGETRLPGEPTGPASHVPPQPALSQPGRVAVTVPRSARGSRTCTDAQRQPRAAPRSCHLLPPLSPAGPLPPALPHAGPRHSPATPPRGPARPRSAPLPGFIVSVQTDPGCCCRSRSRGICPGSGTR